MGVMLGALLFDSAQTTVREKHEEVGGRDARKIEISGIVAEASGSAVEARLDDILRAASREDYDAELVLRPGRRLWVRREKFTREINVATCVGAFTLVLEARVPYEEAIEPRVVQWPIRTREAQLPVAVMGNAPVSPIISVCAIGNIVCPSFSDGSRTIMYDGTIAPGSCLILDGNESRATLDGEDVTAYTRGVFPRLAADGANLHWLDAAESSHEADAQVELRDRWW